MKINQKAVENMDIDEAQPSSKYLAQAKALITLSNADMLQLIEDQQKFVEKIMRFNQIGIECYAAQDYQKALLYLQQAQKILEYAASCGKTIDRFLIIATLHNQAAGFQKMLQLHKSYDYMEAILFNLQTYFQQNPQIGPIQAIKSNQSPVYKQLTHIIHRKRTTIVYSLQFAAISSQVDKHQIAIQSAKKALGWLNSLIGQIIALKQGSQYLRSETNYINQNQLKEFHRYCLGIDKSQVAQLGKVVRALVKKIRQKPIEDRNLLRLKKFSIGQVMQLQPISVQQSNQCPSLQFLLSQVEICRISLYTSISYYTIATQLRLIAKKERLQAELTRQYQKSKIFHLFAIKIAMILAPFFSQYHQHIIRSFKNNYHIDLNNDLPQYVQQQKIKQTLLDRQSFVLQKAEDLANSQQIRTIKIDSQNKNARHRRISSGTLVQSAQKLKNNVVNFNFKIKKKKKSVSKERKNTFLNTIPQSKQMVYKDKNQARKTITQKSQKKLTKLASSSRTKLGKPKNFHDTAQKTKEKPKKSRSTQKTKQVHKNNSNTKTKNRDKILQQYMAFRDSSGKKHIHTDPNIFNTNNKIKRDKKNVKKITQQNSKSKSKSKSKTKKQIKQVKGNKNSVYGFMSSKNFKI